MRGEFSNGPGRHMRGDFSNGPAKREMSFLMVEFGYKKRKTNNSYESICADKTKMKF